MGQVGATGDCQSLSRTSAAPPLSPSTISAPSPVSFGSCPVSLPELRRSGEAEKEAPAGEQMLSQQGLLSSAQLAIQLSLESRM